MPLLQKADRVTVLTVIGGTGVPGPSAEQLIRYLQRNGIVAEPMRVELDGRNTGEAILARAQSLGCDLLIKGAYTQSRRGDPTRLVKCGLARFAGELTQRLVPSGDANPAFTPIALTNFILGLKRTWRLHCEMSANDPKADQTCQ